MSAFANAHVTFDVFSNQALRRLDSLRYI